MSGSHVHAYTYELLYDVPRTRCNTADERHGENGELGEVTGVRVRTFFEQNIQRRTVNDQISQVRWIEITNGSAWLCVLLYRAVPVTGLRSLRVSNQYQSACAVPCCVYETTGEDAA